MKIILGVFDENDNLIGYKTDTFWNLSKNTEHAKIHSEGDEDRLTRNLLSSLNITSEDNSLQGIGGLMVALCNFSSPANLKDNCTTLYVKSFKFDTGKIEEVVKTLKLGKEKNKKKWIVKEIYYG